MNDDFGLDDLANNLKNNERLLSIPIENIKADINQPRKVFNDESLKSLSSSIEAQGLLQPITVRIDNGNNDTYIIIAGERRWRASQIANLQHIQAIVKEVGAKDNKALQMIENIERDSFTLVEEVNGINELVKEYGNSKKAADAIGKSASWIAKRVAIKKSKQVFSFINENKTNDLNSAYELSVLIKKHPEKSKDFVRYLSEDDDNLVNLRKKIAAASKEFSGDNKNTLLTEKSSNSKQEPQANSSEETKKTKKVSHEKSTNNNTKSEPQRIDSFKVMKDKIYMFSNGDQFQITHELLQEIIKNVSENK